MARRASPDDEGIDVVRTRLAASAAAPAPPRPEIRPASEPKEQPAKLAPAPPPRRAAPPARPKRPEGLVVNRKMMVTPAEARQIEETVSVISEAFGSKVTFSQVQRSLWAVVAGGQESIAQMGRGRHRRDPLSVPSKGDQLAMAEYEQALTEFLEQALRRL